MPTHYTDDVVNRFNAQTHVVADPTATPPLQNPDQVNQQILTSRWTWSPAPPVWVAAVAPSQTGVTTPDAIHNTILGRNPEFGGVILVIDSKGYHVRAYNVPKAIADSVDPFMSQAARSHRNDPYGATTEFVSKLAEVNVASGGPATTSPVVNQKHTSWTWLWETLIIIGIALAVVGLIWFAVNRNRKRHNDSASREQVKQELIYAESDVNDLDNAMITNSSTDVSAESLKATSSLHDARRAYETGDYTAARAHLRTVQAAVAKANRKLSPEDRTAGPGTYQPKPDVAAVRSVPDADRKEAEVRTTDPEHRSAGDDQQQQLQHHAAAGLPALLSGRLLQRNVLLPGLLPVRVLGSRLGLGPNRCPADGCPAGRPLGRQLRARLRGRPRLGVRDV